MKVWVPTVPGAVNQWSEVTLNNDFSFGSTGYHEESKTMKFVRVGALTDCRFQILLEIGLNHLANGQYRDAVISTQAALERYREFYLLVTAVKSGISSSKFSELWKILARQSERQLGAYLATVMFCTNSVGNDLSNANTEYRNAVVHGGFFPDEAKTMSFCLAVLAIMQNDLGSMLVADRDSVLRAAEIELSNRLPCPVGYRLSIAPLVDLIEVKNSDWISRLAGHLEMLGKQRFNGINWPNFSWPR